MTNIGNLLQWLLPFIAASIGIVTFIANFKGTIRKFREGDSATMLFVLVTMLCAAFGVERFVNSDQLDKRLSSIEDKLSTSLGGRLLNNYDEIYGTGAKMCSTADEQIRVVISSTGPKAPPFFIDAVNRRLKEKKEAGFSVRYKVVLSLDSSSINDLSEMEKSNKNRLDLFDRLGIRELVDLYVLDSKPPISFDILIVDRKHLSIGFTPHKDGRKLERAIFFENQPKITSEFAEWFDNSIVPLAKPFNRWIEEQKEKRRT